MKKTKKPAASKPKGRRKKAAPIQNATINPRYHPDAAGIDVGAEEFVAALPPDRCEQSVRTFATYTSGVEALRDWLLEHRITTVAMESTGNYWIMLYDKLTEAGIDVYLVNARHVKGVPGKKTDACDAQWLTTPRRRAAAQILPPRACRLCRCATSCATARRWWSTPPHSCTSCKSRSPR